MSPGLQLLEQAHIDGPIEVELVAFCDVHDLIAVVKSSDRSDTAVTVYRLKGEAAFSIDRRDEESKPSALCWKPDGSLLAISWNNDVCCLYSGENGKLLFELPTTRPNTGDDLNWTLDITAHHGVTEGGDEPGETTMAEGALSGSINWTSYQNGEKKVMQGFDDQELTTEDFLDNSLSESLNGAHQHKPAMSDLINNITTLDTTIALPRLSKIDLPSGMRHTAESNQFSTQASTDVVFEGSKYADGVASTLLVTGRDACVSAYMDETIKLGRLQLSPAQRILSASDTRCQTQAMLAQSEGQLLLSYIDLPVKRLSSPLNHVISLNTKRVQSLMAYITHTIRCIHHELQTHIKGIPTRLLNFLNEELRPQSAGSTSHPSNSIDAAALELQHLALLSNFTPVMLEWLKDIVKETGHKRWDQATNSMYDHLQGYIFKNLLPALERFVAAVSALRGQAHFHEHTGKFVIPKERDNFDELLEQVDTLSLVAQRTLRVVTEEHSQFKAFSKWLRVMIDVAVAGPGSKSADETEEREAPNIDMDLCLRYIEGPLSNSLLKVLAESHPVTTESMSKSDFFQHPAVVGMSRERTVLELRKMDDAKQDPTIAQDRDDETVQASSNINLPLLTCLLGAHTRLAIEEINAWQSQALPSSPYTVDLRTLIATADLEKIQDLCIEPSAPSDNRTSETVHILGGVADGRSITRVRVKRRQQPKGSPPLCDRTIIGISGEINEEGKVLHIAFHGPEHVLVLYSPPASTGSGIVDLLDVNIGDTATEGNWKRTLHTWDGEGFLSAPERFVIGGRPGREVVVVFGAGAGGRGTRWEVLDLERVSKEATRAGAERFASEEMDVI